MSMDTCYLSLRSIHPVGEGDRTSALQKLALFTWMVGSFEVGADLSEGEPGRLEFFASVQCRLICVMAALWITARPEGVDRQGAHAGRALNHAHIRRARNSIETLLSRRWSSVEREDGAVITTDARNRKTGTRIIKLFTLAFITALEPVEFAPGHTPGAKALLERVERFVKRGET